MQWIQSHDQERFLAWLHLADADASDVRNEVEELIAALPSSTRAPVAVVFAALRGSSTTSVSSRFRIPLAIAVRGAPVRSSLATASLVDVAPTIAVLAGLRSTRRWMGRGQIAALAHGRDDPSRIVFGQTDELTVALTRDARLWWHRGHNVSHFRADPDSRMTRIDLRDAAARWQEQVTNARGAR